MIYKREIIQKFSMGWKANLFEKSFRGVLIEPFSCHLPLSLLEAGKYSISCGSGGFFQFFSPIWELNPSALTVTDSITISLFIRCLSG